MQTGIKRPRTAPTWAGLLAVLVCTGCRTIPQPSAEHVIAERPTSEGSSSGAFTANPLGETPETTQAFADLIAARQAAQPNMKTQKSSGTAAEHTNRADTLSQPQHQAVVQKPGVDTMQQSAGWSAEKEVTEFGRSSNPEENRY